MKEDWWPNLLSHIKHEDPWDEPEVVVAELKSFDEAPFPGERRSYTALIPMEDFDAVSSRLAGLSHDVNSSGPDPVPESAPSYSPSFWISAVDLPSDRYEPLVLSWTAHDRTVLLPDPRFLMTYGLIPRTVEDGGVSYDDPAGPVHNIVRVSAPSIWDFPRRTTARVTVAKDYLKDYLTLRGMALVQVFYEIRRGDADQETLAALGAQNAANFRFPDRTFQLNDGHRDGVVAQVWGGRVLAVPCGLPVTADLLETAGLDWPRYPEPITQERAAAMRPTDWVYVDDAVLGAYEGVPGFQVHPESGGVTFGTQWGVGFCERIGRDVIRLEVKKLYEGARSSVVRYWHRFAVDASPALLSPEAARERNIADRARDITMALVALGEQLHKLALALELTDTTPENYVGLDRHDLEYRGWWNPEVVERIARHVTLSLTRDDFLSRCVALNSLIVERLDQRDLRRIVRAIGVPQNITQDLRSLKLLDLIVRLAEVAYTSGLSFSEESGAVWTRMELEDAERGYPEQPIPYLFALYDMRIVGSHRAEEIQPRLATELARFGIAAGAEAAGYGLILDSIYDHLAEELNSMQNQIAQALSV